MPILVHLTLEKNRRNIIRSGIGGSSWQIISAESEKVQDLSKAVFCMPVMQDYVVTHQWVREIKRYLCSPQMIGVYLRLPKDEPVWVGRYNTPHALLPLGKAIRQLMNEPQPLGYELIVPRSIGKKEIHGVRELPRITGWRYRPERKKWLCLCDACIRGEPYSKRRIAYIERTTGINYAEEYGKNWAEPENDETDSDDSGEEGDESPSPPLSESYLPS